MTFDAVYKSAKIAVCVFACFALTGIGLAGFQAREATVSGEKEISSLATEVHALAVEVNSPCNEDGTGCGTIQRLNLVVAGLQATPQKLNTNIDKIGSVVDGVKPVLAGAQQTFVNINRPCGTVGGTFAPCGTLADVNKMLDTTRHTEGEVEIAANTFNKHNTDLYNQETVLYGDTHTLVSSANQSVTTFNGILASKDIPVMLDSWSRISVSFAHIIDIGDQLFVKSTHNYLHPAANPWTRTWQQIQPYLLPIAQITGAVALEVTK